MRNQIQCQKGTVSVHGSLFSAVDGTITGYFESSRETDGGTVRRPSTADEIRAVFRANNLSLSGWSMDLAGLVEGFTRASGPDPEKTASPLDNHPTLF